MASPRSFTANWQLPSPSFDNSTNTKSPNGRFWSKRTMNNHPQDTSAFSSRPIFPPKSSTAEMGDSDNPAKRLPQPAILHPQQQQHSTGDYDRFVRKFHQHTLSDSSNPAPSNDSSPTTTISTVDDSSATEPSPGSSPESPPPTTFAVGMLRPRTADERSRPFFELQKQPPPRKGRNLKNLAVVTSRQPGRAASTTSLPLEASSKVDSTILSPSFVKPPTPPRRRPSNLGLTILTPGGGKPPPQEVRLTIPPTPGFGRPGTLRHFQSSPSLPLVTGLGFPPYSDNKEFSRQRVLETILSPIEREESPQIVEEPEEEEEQNFDIPLSREEKPEAYPNGPICVYDPHIDLYLEPTAEQARQYDVILNVANEVRNPFIEVGDAAPEEPDLRIDGGGGIQYAPKRPKPVSSNDSVLDKRPSEEAVSTNGHFVAKSEKDPEYIHIKWEHNSDIVPDLLRLVKLIDEKVRDHKRVLVHCQCGVSRSASLVVAYGLYKDPSMSVQEAYDAVKKRSKWIGPNMNLIMQLQEFRSSLARGGVLPENRALSPLTPGSAASEWRGPFSNHPSALASRNGPLSAGVPPPAKTNSADDVTAISPGPSSAPSGFAWPLSGPNGSRTIGVPKPAHAYVDPSGHVVPVLKMSSETNFSQTLPVRQPVLEAPVPVPVPSYGIEPDLSSPRSTEFAMAPLQPSREVDAADSFGIMSPTTTEFGSHLFDRSALLASLGMGAWEGRADEETPRRSLSLRNRDALQQPPQKRQDQQRLQPQPRRTLRGKISSPTLREQQQLQAMQSQIEASLSKRNLPPTQQSASEDDDALMSPRATEFTNNPFALPAPIPEKKSIEEAPRESTIDPRSPAHKGASPITRSILDVL